MTSLISNFKTVIINPIISLLFVLAFAYFLWGLVEFIWKAGSETEREKGKSHMIWGVTGLFIMLGVMGIINLLLDTFGIGNI
jgi:hypothetical protein